MPANDVIHRRNIVPRWARGICVAILLGLAVVMPIVRPAGGGVPFVVDALRRG